MPTYARTSCFPHVQSHSSKFGKSLVCKPSPIVRPHTGGASLPPHCLIFTQERNPVKFTTTFPAPVRTHPLTSIVPPPTPPRTPYLPVPQNRPLNLTSAGGVRPLLRPVNAIEPEVTSFPLRWATFVFFLFIKTTSPKLGFNCPLLSSTLSFCFLG